MTAQSPVALTIAGSDSGGGAGVQADLRVMHRLGVFGTSVITAVTAQNLDAVTDVHVIPATTVAAQLDAVLGGFEVGAVKTGMLANAETIDTVAGVLASTKLPVIVDPVMVATSGAALLDPQAVAAYAQLFALATLATPNLDEAAVLLGRPIPASSTPAQLEQAAGDLHHQLGCGILLKGGHADGDPVDFLIAADHRIAWKHRRVPGVNTHGTGCMLSSAIAASIAMGHELPAAVERSLGFVHDALERGARSPDLRLAAIESAAPAIEHMTRLPPV